MDRSREATESKKIVNESGCESRGAKSTGKSAAWLRACRRLVRKHVKRGVSLVDELIAARREAARRE